MAALLALLFGGLLAGLIGSTGSGGGDDDGPDTEGRDITGTDGDDEIFGTSGDDIIRAGDGRDDVFVGQGDDFVRGGGGNDLIGDWDSESDARLSSNDTLYGDAGDDTIFGTSGFDILNGGTGDDLVSAPDRTPGGPSTPDIVSGGWGEDIVAGDDGDSLWGGPGEDFFGIVVDDASEADVVVIEDYMQDEGIEFAVFDRDLPNTDIEIQESLNIRDTSNGAMISISGEDLALVRGVAATDVGPVTIRLEGALG